MDRRGRSVGLVEPDQKTADSIAPALRERGFDIQEVSPEDVETVVGDRTVDYLVLRHTGSVDAGELLELVRRRDELFPVVVFAVSGDEALAAQCVALDVDAYVPASDGVDALATAVDELRPADDPRRDPAGMLEALLSVAPRSLSIYFKDRAGRHVAVSDQFPGLIGPPYSVTPDGRVLHDVEDILGQSDFDLYPDLLARETVEDEAWIMQRDEPMTDELEQSVLGDGTEIYVATSKAPWYDSAGTLRGIVGVTKDVTERESQRRDLERQNDRLERFASVLSHDLRNPLNVADGHLQIVRERYDDDQDLELVEEALDRMEELIQEVLTLARTGSVVDDPEPVALGEPARDAWSTVAGGTLDVGDLPTVEGDPERLRTLFENLFRNAVEHDGADVHVTVEEISDGFAVADDGPGIPEEEREDVFDHGVTSREDGTGFGLSIVREIVQAHGWSITATDAGSGGARFEVRFG